MTDSAHNVLVIGNDAATAAAIREALTQPGEDPLETIWVGNFSAAVGRLSEGGIDAILLDPFLPDSAGIDYAPRGRLLRV